MNVLSARQAEFYRHHGFLYPLHALDEPEVTHYVQSFDALEAHLGASLPRCDGRWRSFPHLYLPWVDRLVRHERILDAVEDLIGPDILVFLSTFFVKDPGSLEFTAWHQDATYMGLQPHEHVTAWVALTPASRDAGCMQVVSSRGSPRQLRHAERHLANSMNSGGQTIVEPIDENGGVYMELDAGQFSLHDTLCVHRSAPNRASHRRIGLAISYVPGTVHHAVMEPVPALLVRGRADAARFDLLDAPSEPFGSKALAMHERVLQAYRTARAEVARQHHAHPVASG